MSFHLQLETLDVGSPDLKLVFDIDRTVEDESPERICALVLDSDQLESFRAAVRSRLMNDASVMSILGHYGIKPEITDHESGAKYIHGLKSSLLRKHPDAGFGPCLRQAIDAAFSNRDR